MSIKELQKYTAVSKYARWLETEKRRETWEESVERIKNMMVEVNPSLHNDIQKYYDMIKEQKILGSQRALQFGGKPILKHNARIFNCSASYCDRLRFFQECFYLLLCGSGTGFSVQKHHVELLPKFSSYRLDPKTCCYQHLVHRVEDSIEGWADALGVLLSSYFETPIKGFEKYKDIDVGFSYVDIREKGSPLGCGIGNAPGYEPLEKALEKIRELLDRCIANGQTQLRTIDAFDIVMHSADAVISGGVRRSATIALFSADDELMINAKTGDWYFTNPQRARANISALLHRKDTPKEVFENLFKATKEFGEPGFFFADYYDALCNPCVVGDTIVTTKDGCSFATDLLGTKFNALVDGAIYESTNNGFWKTGNKETIKLSFSSGRELIVTPNHQILTTDGWKEAKDITFEDEIIINNHSEFKQRNIDVNSSDYAKGYLLGSFLGDGNIAHQSAQIKWWGDNKYEYRKDGYNLIDQAGFKIEGSHCSEKTDLVNSYTTVQSKKLYDFAQEKDCFDIEKDEFKHLSKKATTGSWSYLSGLVAGYFDADGTVAVNSEKGNSLRISSNQYNNLVNLQIILNSFGILSKIYKNRIPEGWKKMPDGNGSTKEYYTQTIHELHISGQAIELFNKNIKIRNNDKISKINEIIDSRKRMPNRSVFLDTIINKCDFGKQDVFDCTIPEVNAFDANGIYVHNCCEISWITKHFYKKNSQELEQALLNYEGPITTKETCKDDMAEDEVGLSGWGFCNLSTINGKTITSEEDFYERCAAAAFIGTLQASFTNFPYLGQITELIAKKEALLGVSINGMQHHPKILLNPEIQKKGAEIVKETNKKYARLLNINPAARTTCVKPEGNSAALLGSASGIHPDHSKRYFRIVQANKLESPYQYFKRINPQACEASVWSSNKTDDCIRFCVQSQEGTILKENLTAINMLDNVVSTYNNWVVSGKNEELCVRKELNHNVSNTIHVQDHEWDEVKEYIYKNRSDLAGISLIAATGDKDYNQAPFTAVYSIEEQITNWGFEATSKAYEIYPKFSEYNFESLWDACSCSLGYFEPKDDKQKEWKKIIEKYSSDFFSSNIKYATYALKDAYNLDLWNKLVDSYSDVNYLNVLEEKSSINIQGELACAGGACLI